MNHIGPTNPTTSGQFEWNNPLMSLGNLPSVSSPIALVSSPGLSNINNWDSSNGIGGIYTSYADTTSTFAFLRGGGWSDVAPTAAGILSLDLGFGPLNVSNIIGFRVADDPS